MQYVADVQDALHKVPPLPPAGTGGVAVRAHFVPFHVSANALPCALLLPTARQEAVLAHEMPSSWLFSAPVALGVGVIVHLGPFNVSVSGTPTCCGLDSPAATQVAASKQDTPLSRPPPLPPGFCTLSMAHVVPVIVSTTGL